jgi:hypothetical protein
MLKFAKGSITYLLGGWARAAHANVQRIIEVPLRRCAQVEADRQLEPNFIGKQQDQGQIALKM